MAKVFISYSNDGFDFANKLKENLEKFGIKAWLNDLHPGQDWKDEIEEELNTADAIIVVLSNGSSTSFYVTYEWAYALGKGTRVIPVIPAPFEESQIHPRLGALNYLDFTTPQSRPWDSLISAIQNQAAAANFWQLKIWPGFTDIDKTTRIIAGNQNRNNIVKELWVQEQTTFHQALSMALIYHLLGRISKSQIFFHTSDNAPDSELSVNEVLIGGPNNNDLTKKLLEDIENEYNIQIHIDKISNHEDDKYKHSRAFGSMILIKSVDKNITYFGPEKALPKYIGSGEEGRPIEKDLGIIIIKKECSLTKVVVAGCHSVGTLGAAHAITNKEFILNKICPCLSEGINSIYNDLKICVIEAIKNNAKVKPTRLLYPSSI